MAHDRLKSVPRALGAQLLPLAVLLACALPTQARAECPDGTEALLQVWAETRRFEGPCGASGRASRLESGEIVVETASPVDVLEIYGDDDYWLPAGSDLAAALSRWPVGWAAPMGPPIESSVWLNDPRVPFEYRPGERGALLPVYWERRLNELQLELAVDAWLLLEAVPLEAGGRRATLRSVNSSGAAVTIARAPYVWLESALHEIEVHDTPQLDSAGLEQGTALFGSGAEALAELTPDMVQPKLYKESIEPNIKPGAALLFAHGFNVHFKQICVFCCCCFCLQAL